PPDATNTTVSTDKSAANADNKETITLTLTPRDSHNNVVPLWTFSKDLTIVPSVNATVPGAVTVTTPTQDAAGNVAATLKYVDTSGKLLSKEARAGTTTIAIGKAVKQTVDTRFYPQVHVCTTNLSASGYIVPGQTEVRICDGSNHAVPDGSGYTVTLAGMSATGCTKGGGGVCPPDTVGKKADFTGLTGDDIAQLVRHSPQYAISDNLSQAKFTDSLPKGRLVYYGELASHFGYSQLGGASGDDIFHIGEAKQYCKQATHAYFGHFSSTAFSEALYAGTATGGTTTAAGGLKTLYLGRITDNIKTGGDTNPELFVAGGSEGNTLVVQQGHRDYEMDEAGNTGAYIPGLLVMVNGSRKAAVAWVPDASALDYTDYTQPYAGGYASVAFGRVLAADTSWNLTDMYYVNNWPGTPLTQHKPDGRDKTNRYVTQVNYVTGYICETDLQ
ncbi:hypothetical protein EEN60_25160, partial [Salmonella enterica]|nr:hypothetical protein [Salmonella enterica]